MVWRKRQCREKMLKFFLLSLWQSEISFYWKGTAVLDTSLLQCKISFWVFLLLTGGGKKSFQENRVRFEYCENLLGRRTHCREWFCPLKSMILLDIRLLCVTAEVCQDCLVKSYFTDVCGNVFCLLIVDCRSVFWDKQCQTLVKLQIAF